MSSHRIGALVFATILAGCAANEPPPVVTPAAGEPERRPIVMPSQMAQVATEIHVDPDLAKACNLALPYFSFDPSLAHSIPVDMLVECFATGPMAGDRIKLVGYSDPGAPSASAFPLGQERAAELERYLSSRGISRTGISAGPALGDEGPVEERRVDLAVGE